MNIKYISLLLSLIGITILYILSTFTQPIYIDLEKISEYEGKEITTQATIIDYYTTSYGNQIITVKANNATAQLFCQEPVTVQYGDLVQATGKVEQYNDDWEIIIDQKTSLQIIQQWENITTPLWEIANNPEKFVNLQINTTGYIDSIYDDYFILTDKEANHSIIVTYYPGANITIYAGKHCTLHALLQYDASQTCYLFNIKNPNHLIKPIGENNT